MKIYKQNERGEVVVTYQGERVETDAHSVCVRAIFQIERAHVGEVVLLRGDVFTEWFYADRWYNVFRIQDPHTHALKCYYCNITRPSQFTDDEIRSDDLALDVLILPNRHIVILDQDEFDALPLQQAERANCLTAVAQIQALVEAQTHPFEFYSEVSSSG
ncbi:MAG: DUF402 domain-containing protein [Phototrophicaceae bacterium]